MNDYHGMSYSDKKFHRLTSAIFGISPLRWETNRKFQSFNDKIKVIFHYRPETGHPLSLILRTRPSAF